MPGLCGTGRMMFTKYLVVVDDDVDVHNTSEVLFRLCANTDPQRDSMVAVRKDSPKARPTCLTTPLPRLRWVQNWEPMQPRKLPGEGFKEPQNHALGRRSPPCCAREPFLASTA